MKLISHGLSIAPSKLFTYPMRLINPWEPEVLEVSLSAENLPSLELELDIIEGSTQTLGLEFVDFEWRKSKLPTKTKLKNIYRKIRARSKGPIIIQDREQIIFDARFDVDGNIAHILCNVVVFIAALQEVGHKVTVLLRKDASSLAKKVYSTLNIPIICTDQEVIGKIVVGSVTEAHIRDWRRGNYGKCFNAFDCKDTSNSESQRLFISRRGNRSLVNELEIEEFLKPYGFRKVYFENIPIYKQWSLVKNANVIVGVHGAALSSILFNCRQAKLIELFHPGYTSQTYRRIVSTIGGSWCGVTGKPPVDLIDKLEEKQLSRNFAACPMEVCVDSLIKAMTYMQVSSDLRHTLKVG